MSFLQGFLAGFEHEMANTRKVLERVPNDKLDWKCHEKSHTIGWNANHLAEIPGWVPMTINETELELNPPDGEPYRSPTLGSREEILALFDKNVAAAREAIRAAKDEDMGVTWSLKRDGQAMFSIPRASVLRSFVLNHTIHHRAHLLVYLRMNDVPVPGMYGPSGDEQGM